MSHGAVRRAALALTALTGFVGLVYEVAWERLLATLLGSHSAATAAVLALFLGGLAGGYTLFGRLCRRVVDPSRLLVGYGIVEGAIGIHALLFLTLLELARRVSLTLPELPAPAAFALDVALSAFVVLPGAVLMGATVPLLTQALSRDADDATRTHAKIYGINTLGAFAGALAAGFWLVDQLGLDGVLRSLALVNLAAGAAFAWIGSTWSRRRSGDVGSSGEPVASIDAPALRTFAAIALLSGFAMMTLQTVAIRLGALALGASQLTFALVVAVFIACIAVGSFAVAGLPRVPRGLLAVSLWAMAGWLAFLYAGLENTTWGAHVLRSRFGADAAAFVPFSIAVFASLAALLGPAVAISGATLPLVFHHIRGSGGDLGTRAGTLYGWNTLGSLLGALAGGYLLLYWIDLHHVYRLAVACIVVAATLATWRTSGVAITRVIPAAAVAMLLVAALPPWSADRLAAGLFRERTLLPRALDGPSAFFAANDRGLVRFHTDDPTATITVKEGRLPDGRMDRAIVTNGKSDGFAVGEAKTTRLLALVPALLAREVERTFVVGYGTGVTAAELALLDSNPEVVVAEISPGVIEAAPWFDWANLDASRHPRIRILESDAYRALLRASEPFDVIVSEPSNPWVNGVEMLYSREFLTAARDRLADGGVHAQWFHLYDLDLATVALILRTYVAVFPHASVWYTLDFDMLLIGAVDAESALDVERIAERARRPDFRAALERAEIADPLSLLAHELLPLGALHALDLDGPIHTLYHPRLAHAAGRALFAGTAGELPFSAHAKVTTVGSRNSLVRRLVARDDSWFSEEQLATLARETCVDRPRECVALLAASRHAFPDSALYEDLRERGGTPSHVDGVATSELVRALVGLHGDGSMPLGDGSVAAAMSATNGFARYFHHAVPFDRRSLAVAWARCELVSDAGDCRRERAVAERVLGSLAPEVAWDPRARTVLPVDPAPR